MLMRYLASLLFASQLAFAGTHIVIGDTTYAQIDPSGTQAGAINVTSGTVFNTFTASTITARGAGQSAFNAFVSLFPAFGPKVSQVFNFAHLNFDPVFGDSLVGNYIINASTGNSIYDRAPGGRLSFNNNGLTLGYGYGLSAELASLSVGSSGASTSSPFTCSSGITVSSFTATYGVVTNTITINTGGLINQTVCWKSNKTLSYCTSIVGVDGTCTCN